jgi:hypothetical protein
VAPTAGGSVTDSICSPPPPGPAPVPPIHLWCLIPRCP